LRILVGQKLDSRAVQAIHEGDDKDGFGPIRTTQQAPETRQQAEDGTVHRCIVEVCMSFSAVVPILQASSGEPTRDKELTEFVLHADNNFHLVASVFFNKIGQRLLNLGSNNLDRFLRKIGDLLTQYNYSRSEKLQVLVTHFLDSTLHLWLQGSAMDNEVGDNVRALCHWISNILREDKIRSWKLRDYVIRFLDKYLVMDPRQAFWSHGEDDTETLPSSLLPMLGADRDLRVRFRAALVNARLFSVARTIAEDALALYDTIKQHLTLDLKECVS
jgi:ataxia telangiectasia mutated family protein